MLSFDLSQDYGMVTGLLLLNNGGHHGVWYGKRVCAEDNRKKPDEHACGVG